MKSILLVCLAALASAAFVRSQETDAADFTLTPPKPRATIPDSLEVRAFTPPAPVIPKRVPAMRVDSVITVPTKYSRKLTIIRGEASTLPDIPVPPVPLPAAVRALTAEELERIRIQRRHNINLGATVFDHRVSLVQWRHPDTGESYEAVCGFDIGLLAGTGRFVSAGESYSFMLMHTDLKTDHLRYLAAGMFAKLPSVSPGSVIITKGDQEDLVGTAPITLTREVLLSEKARLLTYQSARASYRQVAAAWEKAHPPISRDETFWFKPHRGSRYLANPTPEGTSR